MAFYNVAILGWEKDGEFLIRVGCSTHFKVVERLVGKGDGFSLGCPDGCLVGEWENEEEFIRDYDSWRTRAKSSQWRVAR